LIEDPYLDTQSWVLRNRLHISDRGVLREAEDLVVSARIAELDLVDLPATYGAGLLRAIHRHLFQDIYDWAGEHRTVGISKNGQAFTAPESIDRELVAFERELSAFRPPQTLAECVPRLARLYERLNRIHPFREGNGRAQRAFWDLFLAEHNLALQWGEADKDENDLACREGAEGRFASLEQLLTRILVLGAT